MPGASATGPSSEPFGIGAPTVRFDAFPVEG